MLWGMINVMQIIVNMPLFNINFPSNAVFFYSFLVDISNFNLIPQSFITSVENSLISVAGMNNDNPNQN